MKNEGEKTEGKNRRNVLNNKQIQKKKGKSYENKIMGH